jgi:hypothetical protein
MATDGGWGAKKKKGRAPTQRDPAKELMRGLSRALAAPYSAERTQQITAALQGLTPRQVREAGRAADLPQGHIRDLVARARAARQDVKGSPLEPVGSAFMWTLRQASRPAQGVLSATAEWSRQGERNPVDLGPLSVRLVPTDPGEILEAGVEGVKLERHDSPRTIAEEAGRIRAGQGESTQAFGGLPGTDLTKGQALPGGAVGRVAYDVGGAAAVDPLTFLTFGTGSAARQGIRAATRVLGEERAAEIARRGVNILSAEEKARLGADVVRRLRGVKPGVAVRVPQPIRAVRRGESLLAPPRTVLPLTPLARGATGVAHAAAATPPGGFLERMFVPRAGVRQAERAGRLAPGTAEHLDDLRARFVAMADASEDLRRLAWIKRTHRLDDDETRALLDALETSPAGLTPKVQAAYDDLNEWRLRLAAEKRAAGVIDSVEPELRALPPIPDEQYVPHLPAHGTARARQAEERARIMRGGPSVTRGEPGFAKRREIRKTVLEANAEGQRFETDPLLAFAKHSVEARRAIATRWFVDEVLQITDTDGVPLLKSVDEVADMSDEALHAAGLDKVTIPRVGEFVVDRALKPEITKVARLAGGDDINVFLRGLDRWMTLWKGYATVPLPFGIGFHMRNGLSNVMLNWLADINPADPAYKQAWTIQRAISKGLKEGDALRFLRGTKWEPVAQAALDRNVIGGAFFIEDIPPDLLRPFQSRVRRAVQAVNPFDPGNLAIRAGRRVGIEIEENARLAHFIAKLREFDNADDAAASVRKYLFDYGDLTAIEKDVFKRVIPFYTFTRKNTPLWIAAALRQPGKYSRLQQWRTALINEAGGQPEGAIPLYLREAGAVPIPGVTWRGDPVMLSPDIPPVAASEVVTPLLQLAGEVPGAESLGLTPHPEGPSGALRPLFSQVGGGLPGALKALYDAYVAERDSFTGRPFYPGERVEAPSYLGPLAALLPRREVEGEQVPSLGRRTQYVMEALAPLLPKVRSLAPTDPRDEDKQLRRALSILTGIQVYPLGEATERSELFRRVEILRRYLADLAARGVDVPDRPPSGRTTGGW